MSIPFKKYGYELNPITNEYKQPQIFLVDKRIHKIGELYPIENLKITVNEINQADEISFTYYRKVDGKDVPFFDKLDDLSIVLVDGYGYFEIAIEKNENSSVAKSVTGISLGHAELSQILTTLEINTDDDTNRTDYVENYPTVFYRSIDGIIDRETEKKYRDSSLLHRILSCVPHYKIGSVSKSLRQIQRTFSWSDTDILSIFNDISKEINCAFDIQIYLENGKPQRVINVYDMQYCDKCYNALDESQKISSNTYKYRTIINGVCQNCGSSEHIKDIGMDTNIFISTENLSDEISIRGDKDSIKNCFKVTGGDDLITAAVQGLAMSASDRIMMFSEKQKQEMSPELQKKLEDYDNEYREKIGDYEKLLETEYNIFDIKHYLRSGKMPPHEKEILKTDQALYTVLKNINEYYQNKFYISNYENYGYVSTRTSIQNMFTTFMPEGYSFTIDVDSITDKTKNYDSAVSYKWYGRIRIYSTGNRDDSYTIHMQPSETYVTCGENKDKYIFKDTSIQNMINNFYIRFYFVDQSPEDYEYYLEQHMKYILSTVDLSYENEKKHPWNLYSYNRLKSFYDGYQSCIEILDNMKREESTPNNIKIINDMTTSYQSIKQDILSQMNVLLDQIFAICSYHGEYDSDFLDADGRVSYHLQYYNDLPTIYSHMIDSQYSGGYQDADNKIYKINEFIGTKPFQCKKCGSSNVSESTNGNICSNPGCESSDIYTYLDIMNNIYYSYCSHKNETITNMRETYQKDFNLENYLNDEQLYAELRSFIREDVYKNDNYISDGLNNTQLIEHAKELRAKAEQELAKACMVQYTIDAPLSSIVGQKSFMYQGIMVNDDYSGFRINNFVRVRIDGEVKKMRIASIGLTFPVTDKIEVTFTNVTNFKGGTLNDVKDIIDKAASMATSYSYVATQAEKGGAASAQFDTIKKEGLDAALMTVKAGRDQDVVIDDHGILLRRKIQETDTYSRYQMKLIDRNLVMTDDNWQSARLAIGLGMYGENLVYGVWADFICGDLIVGEELIIRNKDKNGDCTVKIDKNGITLDGGKIRWLNPINADNVITSNSVSGLNDFKNSVTGSLGVTTITSDSVISPKIGGGYLYIANNSYSVEIDPNNYRNTDDDYLFCIRDINKTYDNIVMGVNQSGNGYFRGIINATSGNIGDWTISDGNIVSSYRGGSVSLCPDTIRIENAEDRAITINTTKIEIYDKQEESSIFQFKYNGEIYFSPYTRINLSGIITSAITIGNKYIANNNYFVLRDTGFDYHWSNENNIDTLKHYMIDSNIGFCEDGLGSMLYKGSEVVNINTNITKIYKELTDYGNIRSGLDALGEGYNFACVGYVQDNFQRSSSSDLRLKKEILPVKNIKSLYLDFKPKQYSFKDGCAENDKVHYGLLAQQVIHVLERNNIDWKNSDLIEEYETRSYMDEGKYAGKTAYRINYENLHALHIAFAQEMYHELEELKKEIALLKKDKEGDI